MEARRVNRIPPLNRREGSVPAGVLAAPAGVFQREQLLPSPNQEREQ